MFTKLRPPVVAIGFLTALNLNPALAHAPVVLLPLHKALPLLHHVAPTVFRSSGLSGSASAVLLRNKLLTQTGFSTGFNTSANQAINGQISSGQLNGTFFESFAGNTSYTAFAPYILAFGNNPLSTMGGHIGTAPSTLINSIVGQTGAFVKSHHAGAGLGFPGLSASGSVRATQLQIKNLVGNSVTAGEKVGGLTFNSPIAAGQFYGTDYVETTALNYRVVANYVYSFGKDPLNTYQSIVGPVTVSATGLRNYIQLANGKVFTYSNGLLPATGYFAGKGVDNDWIFALGKNPLNFFSNFGGAPPTVTYSVFPKPYLYR